MVSRQNGSHIAEWFPCRMVPKQNGSQAEWFPSRIVPRQNGFQAIKQICVRKE